MLELFYRNWVTVLPVVENRRLVGIARRKNVIYALAEKGFWKEREFRKRVRAASPAGHCIERRTWT